MRDLRIELLCPFCRKEHSVNVKPKDFLAYRRGTLIQYAFPYLTPTEREQIITYLCPTCINSVYNIGQEEEEPFEEDFEEPSDIDSDFGFDTFEGCYTYDV